MKIQILTKSKDSLKRIIKFYYTPIDDFESSQDASSSEDKSDSQSVHESN